MVNADGVAMQLEPTSNPTHQGDVSSGGGYDRGPVSGGIIHPTVVIIFGKYAVVVAANAVLGTYPSLAGANHGAIPKFFGGYDFLEGRNSIKLVLGTQIALAWG
jgi:hypothetical protein